MLNPINIRLMKDDGTERTVIIEPMLIKEAGDLKNTGAYKIYKSDDDESFFTEPLLINDTSSSLPDIDNPDYLGTLNFNIDSTWQYNGGLLSQAEQQQIVDHING